MNNLTYLLQLNPFNKLLKVKSGLNITGTSDGFIEALIANDFNIGNNSIFLVLPNISKAQNFYDSLSRYINSDDLLFYPADEPLTNLLSLSSISFKTERVFTLGKMLEKEKKLIVLNQAALMQKTLSKDTWEKAVINLKPSIKISLEQLAEKLVNIGYKREYTVIKTGEFSIRGSIVDIYPIGNEYPIRLDFFDIILESIKIFDPKTQRSLNSIDKVSIYPMEEIFYFDEQKDIIIKRIEKHIETNNYSPEEKRILNKELDEIYLKENTGTKMPYISFFSEKDYSIFDFSDNKKIYFYEVDKMIINEQRIEEDLSDYDFNNLGKVIKNLPFYFKINELLNNNHHLLKLQVDDLNNNNVFSRDVIVYNGSDQLLINELKKTNNTQIIHFVNDYRYLKFSESLTEAKINYHLNPKTIKSNEINIFYPRESPSFNLYNSNINIISENDIYEYKSYRHKGNYKSVISEAVKISDIKELKLGDYVVHYDYGIGQYKGIKTLELSGTIRDYIHIGYEGTDYLYVPVDQVDLILKYSSSEGFVPKLNRLGSTQWKKTKSRVKNKLSDISDKLVQLYSERSQTKGISFYPDEQMHNDFAADFEYEETNDQKEAIKAVTKDMESSQPMDRLICGDVGFGKTEVALRASFKAVYSGKQVAYLVPTTVLARQHYYTFKERFNKYGISVELLSRFVSPNKQKEVLERLSKGLVDIIIGTHRLLSNDVNYKDLGLLIVDEEQRFGVIHKEKIKELKVNIDALSLSATPIPRTLQMSLVGIKDLSMIETPPKNRYPIQTHIIERHPTIIKDAIIRELARGGQVFYLYNRTEDIELIVKQLETLVPEAKVTFAHGKMPKAKLENTISAFIDKKYDILVSTTIIETGIDIPNTNTLLIHQADRLGLSQLYQIRGRVGRSDKIAYAYLMIDKNKKLTEESEKRLKTIKDFQELGSGFKIAMRDLAIRGAGDLLGKEQSGFIDSVGLEMYLKLLEEVIKEKQGIKPEEVIDDQVILSKRHIDKNYISDDEVRLEIHKRIANINNLKGIEALIIELEDRFGNVDEYLIEYMYEKLFYKLISKIGVEKIDKTQKELTLILSVLASEKADGQKLFETIYKTGYPITLKYVHNRIHITLIYDKTGKNYLFQMNDYLSLVV